MKNLTPLDLSVLKYYKEGNELCGFEGVHENLVKHNMLDGDLELTKVGWDFIKDFKDWDSIEMFNNKTKIVIKPKLT